MSRVILLDAGPLGLLTNPKKTLEPRAITQGALDIMTVGHRLIVPAITDYEVRRELEHVGHQRGLAQLDTFNTCGQRTLVTKSVCGVLFLQHIAHEDYAGVVSRPLSYWQVRPQECTSSTVLHQFRLGMFV